uniref:Uncharacterized protein n=1 Tax=Zea mays TaxID=4577 RepID=B4FGC6_MAIZE|nr:unknown [Zea mays]ACN26615.1 unknown [Zea mays]|eukprot:NP_001132358.1 uncharacterized LOC100193802 [Zea mays]
MEGPWRNSSLIERRMEGHRTTLVERRRLRMDARNATPAPTPMEGPLPNPTDGRWRMEVARTFHPRGAHLHPPRPPADLQNSMARGWGGGARMERTLSYPSGPRSSLTFHRRRRIDLGNLWPPTRTTDSTTAPYIRALNRRQ